MWNEEIDALKKVINQIETDTGEFLENDTPMSPLTIKYKGKEVDFPMDISYINEYFHGILKELIKNLEYDLNQ